MKTFEQWWDEYCAIPLELRAEDSEYDIAKKAWDAALEGRRLGTESPHKGNT